MNIHANKTQENKSQSLANAVAQKNTSGESTFQFVDHRPEAVAQRKLQEMANNSPQVKQLRAFQEMANNSPQVQHAIQWQSMADHYVARQQHPIQKKANNTGLPNHLKTGIENLSGYSMDDVKVHYNSEKPARLQAHAYAQGTDIHLASGQERHLPHVVQQKQGRVKPTMQMKGNVNINDDKELEEEVNVMGREALQMKPEEKKNGAVANPVAQKKSNVKQSFGFVDNQPEAITQRKLKYTINNSTRTLQKAKNVVQCAWRAVYRNPGNTDVNVNGTQSVAKTIAAGSGVHSWWTSAARGPNHLHVTNGGVIGGNGLFHYTRNGKRQYQYTPDTDTVSAGINDATYNGTNVSGANALQTAQDLFDREEYDPKIERKKRKRRIEERKGSDPKRRRLKGGLFDIKGLLGASGKKRSRDTRTRRRRPMKRRRRTGR